MLLKELKVRNIRSYQEESFVFPEGYMLLSGDIGSGKSTILQAIEFALFGTSRPDLPAEALLRKGATQGSVVLSFCVEGKEAVIQRNLKKERDAIKQLSGYIIINNLKKELTAVELKAEMIALLGYPEDQLLKNKNYLFRYTVYCPQEEMRSILLDEAENRLDTLRKIFNLDKYKNVRENLQLYLRQVRTTMAQMEVRLEPEVELQLQWQQVQQEQLRVQKQKEEQEQVLKQTREKNRQARQQLDAAEEEQRIVVELRHQLENKRSILEEKRKFGVELVTGEEQLKVQLAHLALPVFSEEELRKKLIEAEEQRQDLWKQRTVLQEKAIFGEQKIKEVEQEIAEGKAEIAYQEQQQKLLQSLRQELAFKVSWEEKLRQLEPLLEKTVFLITKNEEILRQATELKGKISTLEQCPTCLQQVSAVHKLEVINREEETRAKAESLLFEFKKQRSLLLEQREEAQGAIKALLAKERVYTRLEVELQRGEEKKKDSTRKAELLLFLREAQKQVVQELAGIKEERLAELEKQSKEFRQELEKTVQRQQARQRLEEIQRQKLQNQEQMQSVQKEELLLQGRLSGKMDLAEAMVQQKQQYAHLMLQEQQDAVKLATLLMQADSMQKQEGELQKKLQLLQEEKNKLIHIREVYSWLEQHFLKLTYTIEKHVLVQVYHLFNQLFQEWFSVLLDDENMSARLDESFSPVIEQNGYEISIHNLSGGERTAASLAYRLALNKVINDVMQNIKTKDLLILDEPTDGFSSEQLDKVRDVLERINLKQVIIVSHESKIESFVSQVIRIGKEGMVSRVLE